MGVLGRGGAVIVSDVFLFFFLPQGVGPPAAAVRNATETQQRERIKEANPGRAVSTPLSSALQPIGSQRRVPGGCVNKFFLLSASMKTGERNLLFYVQVKGHQ